MRRSGAPRRRSDFGGTWVKRVFDFTAAVAGLALLSPVLLVVAFVVRVSDRGPVFYRARRVGQAGRHFEVLKFRTMVPNAHAEGPGITARGDSRITPVGRWLRRTKLDELPQLINVVRGEMSLVGPRPEDPRYVALYSSRERRVLEARPGLTSPASLAYRNEEELLSAPDWERVYRERILPDKLRMELAYLERRSLRSDFVLLLRTLGALLR